MFIGLWLGTNPTYMKHKYVSQRCEGRRTIASGRISANFQDFPTASAARVSICG
jgi:hypothetical protein